MVNRGRLLITSSGSLLDAASYVDQVLEVAKYALLQVQIHGPESLLIGALCTLAVQLRQGRYSRFSLAIISACDERSALPVHTKSIYGSRGICPCFALGCARAATVGGSTRIYDARKAAAILLAEHGEVARCMFRYKSLAHPAERAEYPIVFNDPTVGPVLRYRAPVPTNTYLSDSSRISEASVHSIVSSVLQQCLLVDHAWQRGDLLIVDNRLTLHDRNPFLGERVLVRARFDEPTTTTFKY
jgi:hypothetical protein